MRRATRGPWGLFLLALLPASAPRASTTPICDGSVFPCRPCSIDDNGQPGGCLPPTPWCEANEPNARYGNCVQCTRDAECRTEAPVCITAGPSTDTCRPCASDQECAVNPAGPACLASGACGPRVMPPESCSSTSGSMSLASIAGLLSAASLLRRRRVHDASRRRH